MPSSPAFYFDLGLWKKKEADFSKAIEIDPKPEELYLERGEVYQQTNARSAAIVDYCKAFKLNPDLAEAKQRL